jgi:hypothetical protein
MHILLLDKIKIFFLFFISFGFVAHSLFFILIFFIEQLFIIYIFNSTLPVQDETNIMLYVCMYVVKMFSYEVKQTTNGKYHHFFTPNKFDIHISSIAIFNFYDGFSLWTSWFSQSVTHQKFAKE